MLCFLTARRLKPESYDRFRQAWEPDEWPAGFLRAYHLRNPEDEDQVISFGLFEGTMEDYRGLRGGPGGQPGGGQAPAGDGRGGGLGAARRCLRGDRGGGSASPA